MSEIAISHFARSYIDLLAATADGMLRVDGWIFHEDSPIARLDISLQGQPWGSTQTFHDRPDVQAAFVPSMGPCPHMIRSGFSVTAPLPPGLDPNAGIVVELAPFRPDGTPLGPWRTHRPGKERATNTTEPPLHLQERIGGSKDFASVGSGIANLIINCVGKYKPAFEQEKTLDWGCGCGRVIAQLMHFVPPANLSGCDIDAEAIAWDRANIPGPTFAPIAPYPPTDYAAQSFDVIYGISVMTHLAEETQFRWLEELRRIARPRAIVALSVIGENLRGSNMPTSLAPEFAEKGFAVFVPNYSELLTEFSHGGYYLESFHSPAYIAAHWSKYFDVLEYVETGHQDLVVLLAR